jgi:hypothetical protein
LWLGPNLDRPDRASAFVVASVAAHNFVAGAMVLATAIVSYATRLNPLWIFAAAALSGLPA